MSNDNNINHNVPQQNVTTEEKDSEQQHQSRSTLSDSTNTSITEEPLIMDWNPDDSLETIFWRRIMTEKQLRQQELHVIKREKEMLERERRQLEPMLGSIKGLKVYGITLEVLQKYITMVEDKAVAECIDPKTAAIGLLGGVN